MTRADSKLPTRSFRSSKVLRTWLIKEHSKAPGLLLRIYKKGSEVVSVTYAQALDQALCFGWIDGQKLPLDEVSWIQKFCPRGPKSGWSKKNREHVERLIRDGQMTPAGQKAVDEAKADGRWAAAYDSPTNATIPSDFMQQLDLNKKAKQFFSTLNRANLYAIAYRLQTAKRPETRARRLKMIVEMLARGEKFH